MKYFDQTSGTWKELDSNKAKVLSDGTNTFTPTDIKNIDNKIAVLSGASGVNEKANKSDLDAHLADYVKQPADGGTTGGTATAYTCSSNPAPTALVDKIGVVITVHTDSGSNPTLNWDNLGARPIKKPNGNAAVLKAGGVYTLRYNATSGNFILQGEGASGNATASDLLSGKTASTDAGDIVGTMPNKVGSGTVITPSTVDQAIPQGYYGGTILDGKVSGDANLIPSNIKRGKTIFGVVGAASEDVSTWTYFASTTSNYTLPSGVSALVGITNGLMYCAGTTVGNVRAYDKNGTLQKNLSVAGTLIYVGADKFITLSGSTIYVYDLNGTFLKSYSYTHGVGSILSIGETTNYYYDHTYDGSQGVAYIAIYNKNGTFIRSFAQVVLPSYMNNRYSAKNCDNYVIFFINGVSSGNLDQFIIKEGVDIIYDFSKTNLIMWM